MSAVCISALSLKRDISSGRLKNFANLVFARYPVPECDYENVVLKPSEFQQEIVKSLGDRAENIRKGGVDSSIDNMLKVTSDGRKCAIDQRLINPDLPDNENSKVNACQLSVYLHSL